MIDVAAAAPAALARFNRAGVLNLADVHVARMLGRVCGEDDDAVLLAAALAVRAPRLGHVCLVLSSVAETVAPEEDADVSVDELEWPPLDEWLAALERSPLVGEDAPLVLDGDRLYLNRGWRNEGMVIGALLDRVSAPAPAIDEDALQRSLSDIDDEHQRRAVETAVRRRLSVIAGGPGTGKTTTIKRILGVLRDQAAALGTDPPQVALVAPTGKAAQRVTESIADPEFTASTIHKLLRRDPGNSTRFRHNARNPLPHDVAIVDETSMVSLDLMAKLLDAVSSDARLILVGDPDQLVSVESGAVLGDIVGPARFGSATAPMGDAIVVLRNVYRHGGGIAELAAAIQSGSVERVLDVLDGELDDVVWLDVDIAEAQARDAALAPVREVVAAAGERLVEAARAGDAEAALSALDALRVVCAHRRGPYGVDEWVAQIERWLAGGVDSFDAAQQWYVGRPVLVTQNDYQLGVLNGDTGVTIAADDERVDVAFRHGEGTRVIAPQRLEHVDTVHAMTIHKSQGSQFDTVVALLPDPTSKILTRELLYTGVTRAKRRLIVAATRETIEAAVQRQVVRSSGLRDALWGHAGGTVGA